MTYNASNSFSLKRDEQGKNIIFTTILLLMLNCNDKRRMIVDDGKDDKTRIR
jgi:hypothetical protein